MLQIYFQSAYNHIYNTVGKFEPESGGILLGDPINYIVRKFVFDQNGRKFSYGYDPDVNFLNNVLKKEWDENKLDFLGFAHSHPRGVQYLSGDHGDGIGDLGYIKKIFEAIPTLERILVPIVYSTADGNEFKIFPYFSDRSDSNPYRTAKLKIIQNTTLR